MHIIYAVTTCSDKVYKQLFSQVAVKPACPGKRKAVPATAISLPSATLS